MEIHLELDRLFGSFVTSYAQRLAEAQKAAQEKEGLERHFEAAFVQQLNGVILPTLRSIGNHLKTGYHEFRIDVPQHLSTREATAVGISFLLLTSGTAAPDQLTNVNSKRLTRVKFSGDRETQKVIVQRWYVPFGQAESVDGGTTRHDIGELTADWVAEDLSALVAKIVAWR